MTTNLEAERRELHAKKTELVLSKKEHETKLIEVKNVVRTGGRMPSMKYKQCCDSQNTHARAIMNIEGQIAAIKTRLREISDIEFREKGTANGNGCHQEEIAPKSFVAELVLLRQEYQNFAADGTRVSSMRQMAAEFVLRLNPIIKRAIGED